MASMPLFPGHDDVHQDHVGLLGPRLEDGVPGVAGLADDLDVGLGFEHPAQAAPDDRWSSTISTRIGVRSCQRHLGDDRRPGAGSGLDPQLAAQECQPFAHPEEAEALHCRRRG